MAATRGSIPIEINAKDVDMALRSGKFLSHMVEIDHQGERQPVIPRAIQFHPVTDMPMHIDLYRVEENAEIAIDVVVHFKNQDLSPGLKRGGVLNIVRHTIKLKCKANKIPEEIVVDLTGMDIGDFDPHLGDPAAGRHAPRDPRPRLHRRHHRRPQGGRRSHDDHDRSRRGRRVRKAPRALPRPKARPLRQPPPKRARATRRLNRLAFRGAAKDKRAMLLLVGLGNPGAKYAGNRHNIGFMAADAIARAYKFGPWKKKFRGEAGRRPDRRRPRRFIIKPQTFYNDSGHAVAEAARFHKIPSSNIVVFYDEIDLAPGRFRMKTGRRRGRQ